MALTPNIFASDTLPVRLNTIDSTTWISTKIAERLAKGAVVEIAGRLFTTAYKSGSDAKASLNCHVSNIKVHYSPKKESTAPAQATASTSDDLPF